jgi:hypothetical protein
VLSSFVCRLGAAARADAGVVVVDDDDDEAVVVL